MVVGEVEVDWASSLQGSAATGDCDAAYAEFRNRQLGVVRAVGAQQIDCCRMRSERAPSHIHAVSRLGERVGVLVHQEVGDVGQQCGMGDNVEQ